MGRAGAEPVDSATAETASPLLVTGGRRSGVDVRPQMRPIRQHQPRPHTTFFEPQAVSQPVRWTLPTDARLSASSGEQGQGGRAAIQDSGSSACRVAQRRRVSIGRRSSNMHLPPLWRAMTPSRAQRLISRKATVRSVALQLLTVIVLAEGETPSDKSGLEDTHSKPLLPEYLPYEGVGTRAMRGPIESSGFS